MSEKFGEYKGFDPPRVPVKVSINRNHDHRDPQPIRIEVTTADYRTLVAFRMSLADFARAVTGRGACDGEGWVPGITDTEKEQRR